MKKWRNYSKKTQELICITYYVILPSIRVNEVNLKNQFSLYKNLRKLKGRIKTLRVFLQLTQILGGCI